ncbi:hypothetical protein ACQP1O_18210 [Nocardia sp. CA-151230]|uniref:hypothetical protein n=1 Tax=Nocardia sp. CA-151230 TaxID=3239982 RepID=UPI003D8A2A95
MRSLEEEFAEFIAQMKRIDWGALAARRDELREELALFDQAVAAVPAGARRGSGSSRRKSSEVRVAPGLARMS